MLRDEPFATSNLYFTYMIALCGIAVTQERLEKCSYLGEAEELLPTMKAKNPFSALFATAKN